MRFSLPAPLLLPVFLIAFMLGGSLQTAAQQSVGTIAIEYVPPTNPALQEVYGLLKERHSLEKIQEAFSPFRFPENVRVATIECGQSNAWYQRKNHVPTVTLCYEYLQEIWENLPKDVTEGGTTAIDALAGQFFFAVAHEFGHLLFDVYQVPVFGREEDAADNFATFIMLQFRDGGRRLISGAAYSYNKFVKDYKAKPKATLPLGAFSSNHGQPEERFFNLLCVAYGSNDKLFADVVEKGWLPKSRAKDCRYEFEVLQFAFQNQIQPHIDRDRARKVLERDWLDITLPRPPGR